MDSLTTAPSTAQGGSLDALSLSLSLCLCRQSQMQFIDKTCVPRRGEVATGDREGDEGGDRDGGRAEGRKLAVNGGGGGRQLYATFKPSCRYAVMPLCALFTHMHTLTPEHLYTMCVCVCECVWQTAAATNATKHLPICLRQNFGNILLTNEKSERENVGSERGRGRERSIEVARQQRKVGRRLKSRRETKIL